MSLTILIPSKNEQKVIFKTIKNIIKSNISSIDYEIVVINDFSTDNTVQLFKKYKNNKKIKLVNNIKPGLGSALKVGIEKSSKEYICIFMADQSDSISDMMRYYKIISKKDYDAVFGSRFIKGSKLKKYPFKKLIFNRIFNNMCKLFFLNKFNDFTNAFKIYKKNVLLSFFPIVSENFNVFLELPLKTVSRNFTYKIIPISWKNRTRGNSKFIIKELTSKYFFTFLYCLLEKILLKKK
jgi:dolichol-phosphate mannosyltransferase